MKVLTRSRYGQPKAAQGGYDPIASGLPRTAIRGRPFLTEHADNNRSRYYKGGLAEGVIRRLWLLILAPRNRRRSRYRRPSLLETIPRARRDGRKNAVDLLLTDPQRVQLIGKFLVE